jgi:hypothetical protein
MFGSDEWIWPNMADDKVHGFMTSDYEGMLVKSWHGKYLGSGWYCFYVIWLAMVMAWHEKVTWIIFMVRYMNICSILANSYCKHTCLFPSQQISMAPWALPNANVRLFNGTNF